MINFFLLGIIAVSCINESCYESLTIYNFSKSHKKENQAKDKEKQTSSSNAGLISDLKYVLQLPLLWSVELVTIYSLLAFLKPSWISVPVQVYFIAIGMQTLYSYVKAKLAVYATQEISLRYQKILAVIIAAMTVLSYALHFVPGAPKLDVLHWISGNSLGYTLLIKLISSV